jgi:alpha-mannosidase
VVGYAHLDTEGRWEYPQVIDEYLRKTMEDNFVLIDKYPHYIFDFSGANRYRLMKEYYPADFARLKKYVDQGRWFPTGSSMEEGDVNAPSGEADHPTSPVRQRLVSQRAGQGQRGIYVAGLSKSTKREPQARVVSVW